MRPAHKLDFGMHDPLDIWLPTKELIQHPDSPVRSVDRAKKLSAARARNGLERMNACKKKPHMPVLWHLRRLHDWIDEL